MPAALNVISVRLDTVLLGDTSSDHAAAANIRPTETSSLATSTLEPSLRRFRMAALDPEKLDPSQTYSTKVSNGALRVAKQKDGSYVYRAWSDDGAKAISIFQLPKGEVEITITTALGTSKFLIPRREVRQRNLRGENLTHTLYRYILTFNNPGQDEAIHRRLREAGLNEIKAERPKKSGPSISIKNSHTQRAYEISFKPEVDTKTVNRAVALIRAGLSLFKRKVVNVAVERVKSAFSGQWLKVVEKSDHDAYSFKPDYSYEIKRFATGTRQFKARLATASLNAVIFENGETTIDIKETSPGAPKSTTHLSFQTRDELQSLCLKGELSQLSRSLGAGAFTEETILSRIKKILDEIGISYNVKEVVNVHDVAA